MAPATPVGADAVYFDLDDEPTVTAPAHNADADADYFDLDAGPAPPKRSLSGQRSKELILFLSVGTDCGNKDPDRSKGVSKYWDERSCNISVRTLIPILADPCTSVWISVSTISAS